MYAGFEFVDGDWRVGHPGIGPEGEWMISVAELMLCFITIRTDAGTHEFFFGANPVMVFGADPAEVPDYDVDEFIDFFTAAYPDAAEGIGRFVETYRVMSTDSEPRYQSPDQAGDSLVSEWCSILNLPDPMADA